MSFNRYILLVGLCTALAFAESKTPRLDAIEAINKQLYTTVIKNKQTIIDQNRKVNTLQKQLLQYMQLQQKSRPKGDGFYPSDMDEVMKKQNDKISMLYNYIYFLLFAMGALALYTWLRGGKKSNQMSIDSMHMATNAKDINSMFTDTKKEKTIEEDTAKSTNTEAKHEEVAEVLPEEKEEIVVPQITSKEYLQKGIKAYSSGDYIGALENFELGINNAEQNSSMSAELSLAKAVAYDALGEPYQAISAYDEVINDFEDKDDDMLQEQVARAMVSKGTTFGKISESKKAILTYDEVIDKFSDSQIPNIQEQVARAYFNKGVRLGQLGRPQESIRVYGQVISKYKDSSTPILNELVARAMYNKGVRYTKLHDLENAIKAYDEVIDTFRSKSEIRVQEQVARAMFNKAMSLNKQEEAQKAIFVYENLINTYKDSDNIILSERVSSASANIAEIELKLKNDVTFDTQNSIYKNLDFNNKLKFDMLFILSDAMKAPQDKELQAWKDKYDDVSMEGYSFEELEKWSSTIEDVSVKSRIKEYISAFKSHGIE